MTEPRLRIAGHDEGYMRVVEPDGYVGWAIVDILGRLRWQFFSSGLCRLSCCPVLHVLEERAIRKALAGSPPIRRDHNEDVGSNADRNDESVVASHSNS